MAMESHVFFCGKLPTKAALTRAMKELGFPLAVMERGSLEHQRGSMAMKLRQEETGVEFDVFDGRANVEELAAEDAGKVDPSFDRSANFRWVGEDETVAAWCAAAALARLTDGIVRDDEEGKLLSPDAAVRMARKILKASETANDPKRPGTRPADIKRYLKDLLELRRDLVLVGRLLLVRPVRHLLRGALLGRTIDKYTLELHGYVEPLYGCFDGRIDDRGWFQVWKPHFQPFLMNVLEEDIFSGLGQLTTLADVASEWTRSKDLCWRNRSDVVRAFVLAGEPERAAEFIRTMERDSRQDWIKDAWKFLDRDIASVCADFRASEESAAKALKLGDIWEPAPFPAELPAAERARAADPLFVTTPWVPQPPWLLQDAPEVAGDVRFAQGLFHRNGRALMLVPLTPAEAEERHRKPLRYVLATRLLDDVLLVLTCNTSSDPEEPPRPGPQRPPVLTECVVQFYSSSHYARATFHARGGGFLRLWTVEISTWPERRSIWLCYLDVQEGRRSIHDDRSGEHIRTTTPLSPTDLDLMTCPMPGFGEVDDLTRRVRAVLNNAGYGEFA